MAFKTPDSVKETSTTTGTGTLTLAGAVTGFQAFTTALSNSDTCPYVIEAVDANGVRTGSWETGIGTFTTSGTTLARTTVIGSSNSNAAVNFGAGTKNVFIAPLSIFGVPKLITASGTLSGTSYTFSSIPQYYKSILFEVLGASHDSGSNQTLRVELSADNSTFTTAFAVTGTGAASQTYYGGVQIPGYSKAAGLWTFALANLGSDITEAVGAVSTGNHAWRIAAGITAVRFSPSGGNFDAGSINLYGL